MAHFVAFEDRIGLYGRDRVSQGHWELCFTFRDASMDLAPNRWMELFTFLPGSAYLVSQKVCMEAGEDTQGLCYLWDTLG